MPSPEIFFTTPDLGTDIAARWEELHNRAQAIAQMAALATEPFAGEIAAFPQLAERCGETERELIARGIEDIDAILQPGLTALLSIEARGQDPIAPALALWREYYYARKSLLGLAQCTKDAA